MVVSAILEGNIDDHSFVSAIKVREAAEQLQLEADNSGIHGFAEVTVARNRFDGFCSVCQLSGLGSFKPNCVILAWPMSVRCVIFILFYAFALTCLSSVEAYSKQRRKRRKSGCSEPRAHAADYDLSWEGPHRLQRAPSISQKHR